MSINFGKLDQLVTVQARFNTRDAQGSAVVTYVDQLTVRGERVSMTGSKARSAGALRANVSLILRIRYYAGLSEQHRIILDGRTYDILFIEEEGRRRSQLVACAFTEDTQ